MKKILIIEDDRELNKGLCVALEKVGYAVVPAFDLKTAEQQVERTPALILLDINLPDGNGLDFLAELKKRHPKLPVILLTSNDTDMDIVSGLEQGADDYITKPFSLAVLRARVAVQLRKDTGIAVNSSGDTQDAGLRSSGMTTGMVYRTEEYFFDFGKLIFKNNDQLIELSRTEQRLLKILVNNSGLTLKRSQLIDHIWTDGEEYVDENALSVAVKRLRDKLDAKSHIRTIYGIGYRWEE